MQPKSKGQFNGDYVILQSEVVQNKYYGKEFMQRPQKEE